MRFGEGLAFTYRKSWAFIGRAWWLVPVPVLPSLLFSLAEIHALVPQQYLESAGYLVLVLGSVLAVASTYWVMRFLALGESVSAAISVDRQSAISFAPYLVCLSVFWFGIGLTPDVGLFPEFLFLLFGACIECMFAPWSVMAPSGSRAIGPIKSVRAALPKMPWAIVFLSVATFPFDTGAEIFRSLPEGWHETPWVAMALTGSEHLAYAIGLVVFEVAIFVIAHRMGVRISNTGSLERVFD